jgi:ParB family chromosome partitioning protein
MRQKKRAYDTDSWFTPIEVVEAARMVLGQIDLDPATSREAQELVVHAERFYTREDDGLVQPWAGRVWLNPPYSHPLVAQFATKLHVEYVCTQRVTAAILLVNNTTENPWFQQLLQTASAICFPRHRLQFWHLKRKSPGNNRGQALFYLGPAPTQFQRVFGNLLGETILLLDR